MGRVRSKPTPLLSDFRRPPPPFSSLSFFPCNLEAIFITVSLPPTARTPPLHNYWPPPLLVATPILAHAHHAPLQCACDACAAAITTLFQLTQRILVFPFSSFWIYMNGTFIFPMECSVVPDSFAYLIVVSTKPTSPGTSLTGCDNGISLRQLWLSYYQCSF